MAQQLTCPGPEQLRQLALGELPETAATACAEHVDRCPACLEALRRLKLDDPLLEALTPPGSTDSLEENAVQRLIDNLSSRPLGMPDDSLQLAGTHDRTETDLISRPQEPPRTSPDFLAAILDRHPRYRILSPLGTGGMGIVYKAEHKLMGRPVALKVIKHLSAQQPVLVKRFLQEVKALARVTHPNIVTSYDADQAGDLHFLVMEYVEGISLKELVETNGPLPVVQACRCIRQAAEGLQYAHDQGMVHRDIKPDNLLLAGNGQVKVLDFGLARFLEEESGAGDLTEPGLVMGTPDYIAPEQALDAHQADVRADIYSLGCTLYYLLAGQPPFAGAKSIQKIFAHREQKPPSLSIHRPDLPPGLIQVVERMLAKDPARRYQTAAAVAEALAPFADSGSAAPPPRRPRWPLALGLVGAAALLVAALNIIQVTTPEGVLVIQTDDKDIAVTVHGGGKEITITDAQTNQKLSLKAGTYEISPAAGRTGYKVDRDRVTITRGGEAIVHISKEKPANPQAVAAPARPQAVAAEPVQLLEVLRLRGHRGQANEIVFAPDGETALSAGVDGTVRRWQVATGEELQVFPGQECVWGLALTRDGRQVLSGGGDFWTGGKLRAGKDFNLKLWEISTGKEVSRFAGHERRITNVVLAPDGRQALTASLDGTVRLWDRATGQQLRHLKFPGEGTPAVAFAPDGRSAVLGCWNGDVQQWEVSSGNVVRRFRGHTQAVRSVEFSPDGQWLLTASLDGTVRLWDVARETEVKTFEHDSGVGQAHFLPDGRRLVSISGMRQQGLFYRPAGADSCVRVWDLKEGRLLCRHEVASPGLFRMGLSPDGRLLLVSAAGTGMIRGLWLTGGTKVPGPAQLPEGRRGQLVLDIVLDRPPLLVLQKNKIVTVLPAEVNTVELEPGSYELALGPGNGDLLLRQEKITVAAGGKVVVAIGRPPAPPPSPELKVLRVLEGLGGAVWSLALSRDDKRALVASNDLAIRLVDLATTKDLVPPMKHETFVSTIALSPDGKLALSAADKKRDPALEDSDKSGKVSYPIRVWDTATGKELRCYTEHTNWIGGLAFLPDGRHILSGGDLRLWDVHSRETRKRLPLPPATCLTLSADGKRALTGCRDGSVYLWDLEAGRQRLHLMGHRAEVKCLAFSPDGRLALSGGVDRTARLWNLQNAEEVRVLVHPTGVKCVAFTQDGQRALSGSGFRQDDNRMVPGGFDSRVRLWDLQTGKELAHHEGSRHGITTLAVTGDGRSVLVGTGPELRLLELPK